MRWTARPPGLIPHGSCIVWKGAASCNSRAGCSGGWWVVVARWPSVVGDGCSPTASRQGPRCVRRWRRRSRRRPSRRAGCGGGAAIGHEHARAAAVFRIWSRAMPGCSIAPARHGGFTTAPMSRQSSCRLRYAACGSPRQVPRGRSYGAAEARSSGRERAFERPETALQSGSAAAAGAGNPRR